MARTRRRNSEKNGRNGRRGNRNGNGSRNAERQFEPSAPDKQEFIPYGDDFLSVGRWNDSGLWNYIGRTEASEESDIFRSYEGDEIPDHVPALVTAAEIYLADKKLPKQTRTKLETFVSAMDEAGYAEAA